MGSTSASGSSTRPAEALVVPVGVLLVIAAANLASQFAALWRGLSYALLGGTMTDVNPPASAADLRRALAIHATVSASERVPHSHLGADPGGLLLAHLDACYRSG
jgi:hypothetical protein